MKMTSQLLWRSIWLLFAALWLSACGGGGESQPTPPAVVLKPVQNAAISLQFEAPERINSEGTLAISLNAFSQEQGALQIAWTLPEGFTRLPSDDDSEGKISIKAPKVTQDTNYQIAVEIKDSGDNLARHVHPIRVLRRVSTVTITGMVTDTVIANAKVSAWLGNEKLGESDADENGQYTLALTLGDSTAVTQPVELRARGDESRGQSFVEFRSLIPSLTSLIADSGQTDSDEVTIDTSVDFGVNITNVTSAVSSLLPQTTLESDQSLNQALLSIDTAEVLRRATLIKLLVDKPAEYPLPEGVNNTVAFLQDSQAKQQIEDQATANGNTDFDDIQKQILEDKQLVSDNAKLAAAEYIVQLDPDAFALHLNADGTGQIHAYTSSGITWNYANRIHTITVNNPVETYRDEEGWVKRLKKIDLQVINQSNGRAMANITRVFDRYENGVSRGEWRFENESAVVIEKRNTLLIPYSQLLGAWEISEKMWVAEPEAPFILRFFENGRGLDDADQEEFNWGVQNNRIVFSNTNQQGKQETSQLWLTRSSGDVYSFYLEDPHADAEELPIYYGTMRRVGDNPQPGENSEKLTLGTQYIVQDHSVAFAIQLDQDGTGNINADTSSAITWSYSASTNHYLIKIDNPVQIEADEDRVLKLVEVEISNLKKHDSSLTSSLATHSVWYPISNENNDPLVHEYAQWENLVVFDTNLPFLFTESELVGDWQITENTYQGETFAMRLNSDGSSYDYAEQSNGSWQLANNRLLMPYNENGQPATTEIWFTTLLDEVGEQSSESFPTYRFFAIDRYDDGSNLKVIYGTFTKLMESPSQPDTRPLSQQADIQDPTLAQCLDESGFSNLSSIRDLYCADSDLQSISSLQGLSNLTGLEKLHLGYLQPTSLSSSDFPSSIRELTIHNSNLFSADLHNLEQLRVLNIWNTVIDAIDFASLTQLTELYLPDNPNLLSPSALSALTNLERLDLSGNQLTEIDLKGLKKLTHLFVSNNQLTALDLSDNPNLQEVQAWDNNLISIDTRHLEQLEYLILGGNKLSQIDVANNVFLKGLNVANNNLADVDVSKLNKLEYLNIGGNQLTSLNVSNNSVLIELYVFENKLSSFDLSSNHKLENFFALNNQLTSLDISSLPELRSLNVDGNQLASLDLSNNPKLYFLSVSDNQFTSLDVTLLPELQGLQVGLNQLTGLDLSNNPKVRHLNANENKLTSLNISHLSELSSLDVMGNQLTHLDISQNPMLYWLSVAFNQLTEFNVDHLRDLEFLQVQGNQLTNLDLINKTKLLNVNASSNQLTTISGIEELNVNAFIDLTNNSFALEFEAYLRDLQNQGYSNLYF
ncbi:leucine-rich repeat domain-containing protein [Vibrio navarrensis]|uniref:leucine-rich repeat domain-containing protein n=1 Tax=Vibrio navarrensis TaxID=29495 RepID=UPI0018DBCF22|nr:leucine-rich repeat domain-containing protein [Vibrio navarrensis]MBH9741807.1 hypothetical protein [Vibrio navarrensis]